MSSPALQPQDPRHADRPGGVDKARLTVVPRVRAPARRGCRS